PDEQDLARVDVAHEEEGGEGGRWGPGAKVERQEKGAAEARADPGRVRQRAVGQGAAVERGGLESAVVAREVREVGDPVAEVAPVRKVRRREQGRGQEDQRGGRAGGDTDPRQVLLRAAGRGAEKARGPGTERRSEDVPSHV